MIAFCFAYFVFLFYFRRATADVCGQAGPVDHTLEIKLAEAPYVLLFIRPRQVPYHGLTIIDRPCVLLFIRPRQVPYHGLTIIDRPCVLLCIRPRQVPYHGLAIIDRLCVLLFIRPRQVPYHGLAIIDRLCVLPLWPRLCVELFVLGENP